MMEGGDGSGRSRDGRATRSRLLWAAFHELHRAGYHKADLGTIHREAGVTKGALYYHFGSKRELGYAVIDEILHGWILDRWMAPVVEAEDPLVALIDLARWGERNATAETLAVGCPLAKLSEELAGADEGFRQRLASVYRAWREALAARLEVARRAGQMSAETDPRAAAAFVVAAWRGSIGLAKTSGELEILGWCRQGLGRYLGVSSA